MLRLVSEATKPDIICLVETWLDNDVLNNEIFLSNYQLFRLECNRYGGGIAFSCNVLLQGGPNNLEFLSVSIVHTPFVNRLCVCLFYRPPSSPVSIFNDLCTTLHIVNPAQFSNFLLIGDFNVNFCNQEHYLFSYVSGILYSCSLCQVAPSYTHISPTGTKSLIDLALLSNTEHLQHCTTIPPLSTSDHLGISLVLTWKARATNPCKSRRVWLYKEGNYTRASQLIAQSDWNTILSGCDTDKAAEQWSTKFLAIMDECIPSRYLRPKQNLPWITTNIVQHIRKRTTLFQRAKRSNKEPHWSQYKKLHNKVVNLLGKQLYFSKLMCTNKKNFWKSVKLLTKNHDSIPTLKLDDCSAVNDEDKANVLNTVFAKFWNTAETPLTEKQNIWVITLTVHVMSLQ